MENKNGLTIVQLLYRFKATRLYQYVDGWILLLLRQFTQPRAWHVPVTSIPHLWDYLLSILSLGRLSYPCSLCTITVLCFAIVVGRDLQAKPPSGTTRSNFPPTVRKPTACCWTYSSLPSRPMWMLMCNPLHRLPHFHLRHPSLLLHHLMLTWNPLYRCLLRYLRLTWRLTNHLSRKPCYHHSTLKLFLDHPKFLGTERPTQIFPTKMNMQMPDRPIRTILLHLNRSGNWALFCSSRIWVG